MKPAYVNRIYSVSQEEKNIGNGNDVFDDTYVKVLKCPWVYQELSYNKKFNYVV